MTDAYIIGAPTLKAGLEYGKTGTDWDEFLFEDEAKGLKSMGSLEGKKVAVFGLGDAWVYQFNFIDAVEEMYLAFEAQGATMGFGHWPIAGYQFDESKAIRKGLFMGLAIDEHNGKRYTGARVRRWIKQLESEGFPVTEVEIDCDEEEGGEEPPTERRRAEALVPSNELAWYSKWGKSTSCWLQKMGHSAQEQLGGCANALGLQLEDQFKHELAAAGKTIRPHALMGAEPESGCDWVRSGATLLRSMPKLPSVEGDFEFVLPPLPNLTPWGVRKWQELSGERGESERDEASVPSASRTTQTVRQSEALAMGVLGGGAAMAVGTLIGFARRARIHKASSVGTV